MARMPLTVGTATTSARGVGRASVSTVSQPVRMPSLIVPRTTLAIGAPLASRPPITYGVPASATRAPSERGSGSGGPSLQPVRLPLVTIVASTLAVAPLAVRPPIRYRFSPELNAPPAARPSGRASWGGLSSHGTTAPAGAGQGRSLFSAGQRLIGLIALKPTSIVGATVK